MDFVRARGGALLLEIALVPVRFHSSHARTTSVLRLALTYKHRLLHLPPRQAIKRLVNLNLLDDQSSSSKARELVEANIMNADLIWGPVSSSMTSKLLPLTEARQTLLLAHGASLPTIFTSGLNSLVVSTLSPASDYMTAGLTKLQASGAST